MGLIETYSDELHEYNAWINKSKQILYLCFYTHYVAGANVLALRKRENEKEREKKEKLNSIPPDSAMLTKCTNYLWKMVHLHKTNQTYIYLAFKISCTEIDEIISMKMSI